MMKYYILWVFFFCSTAFFISCAQPEGNKIEFQQPIQVKEITVYDTVFITEPDTGCITELHRLQREFADLKFTKDSISNKLFLSNYKVEKVRYYLNICLRDRTQDKFLKGWIRRAIE